VEPCLDSCSHKNGDEVNVMDGGFWLEMRKTIRTAKVDGTNTVRHNTAGTEHLPGYFMLTGFTTTFLADDVSVECWKVSITAARKIAKQRVQIAQAIRF
jgi:hypothetical protein